jgi:hypothetical protein
MPIPSSTQSSVIRKPVSASVASPSRFRLSCCLETMPPERAPVASFAPAKISSSLLARGAASLVKNHCAMFQRSEARISNIFCGSGENLARASTSVSKALCWALVISARRFASASNFF